MIINQVVAGGGGGGGGMVVAETYADLPFVPNTGEEMYYVLNDSEEVVGTKVSPDFTGVDSALLFFDKLMIKESPEAPTISPTELGNSYVGIRVYDKNGLYVNDHIVSLECFDGINFVLSVSDGYFMYAWNNFSFNDEGTTYNFTQGWNKLDESSNDFTSCDFSEVLNTFDFVTVEGGINYNHVSPFFDTYDIPCIKHPEGLYVYNHETWNQVSFGKTKVVDHFDENWIELIPVDNTLYNFGSLYPLYIPVINDGVNLFHITFSTGDQACNVYLPANVVWAGETPDFAANSLCEISFARIKTADGYKFVARGSAVEVTA